MLHQINMVNSRW